MTNKRAKKVKGWEPIRFVLRYCWWKKYGVHQLIDSDSVSHYLQGLVHLCWCKISAINSIKGADWYCQWKKCIKSIHFHHLQTLKLTSENLTHRCLVCLQFVFCFGENTFMNLFSSLFFWTCFCVLFLTTVNLGDLFQAWEFWTPPPHQIFGWIMPNPSGIPEGVSLFPDEEEDVEKLYLGTSLLLQTRRKW